MNELIGKLLKLKTPHKVAVTAGRLPGAGRRLLPVLLRRPVSDSITAAEAAQDQLTEELTTYEKRKVEYLAYRNELKQLQEEQRELLRVLPKRDEIATLHVQHPGAGRAVRAGGADRSRPTPRCSRSCT